MKREKTSFVSERHLFWANLSSRISACWTTRANRFFLIIILFYLFVCFSGEGAQEREQVPRSVGESVPRPWDQRCGTREVQDQPSGELFYLFFFVFMREANDRKQKSSRASLDPFDSPSPGLDAHMRRLSSPKSSSVLWTGNPRGSCVADP